MKYFTVTCVITSLSIIPMIVSSGSFGGIGPFGGYGGIGNFGGPTTQNPSQSQTGGAAAYNPHYPGSFGSSIGGLGNTAMNLGGNILKPLSAIARSPKNIPSTESFTAKLPATAPAPVLNTIQAPGIGSVGNSPGAISGIIGPEGTGSFSGFGVVKGIIGPNSNPLEQSLIKRSADDFWSSKVSLENQNQFVPKTNSNRSANSSERPVRLCREILSDGREAYVRC